MFQMIECRAGGGGGALKTIIVKLEYADCHSRERLLERPARRKDLWCLKRHALKSNGLGLWIENTFVKQAVLVRATVCVCKCDYR